MKKSKQILVLIVLAISTCFTSLHAQGLFVKINAGYGLKASSQNMTGFTNQTSATGSITREQVNISFGKGFNFGAGVGYMFSENIRCRTRCFLFTWWKIISARDIYRWLFRSYILCSFSKTESFFNNICRFR